MCIRYTTVKPGESPGPAVPSRSEALGALCVRLFGSVSWVIDWMTCYLAGWLWKSDEGEASWQCG